jgi:SAM-dependent methyltransferase
MRESTPRHWDAYWRRQTDLDDAYSNEQRLLDALLAAGPVDGRRVLEVGAGSGRDAVRLAALGADVTVLDYVAASLDVVARNAARAGVRVALVHADALRAPFGDGTFDVVLHQGLLEHFRDPRPLLAENRRVLRAGGLAVIDVPQRWHAYTLVKKALIAADRWFAGWETEYSPGQLAALMRAAGFEVTATFGDWMVPSFAYRAARRALADAGIARLPQHPVLAPAVHRARGRVREAIRRRPAAAYTFATVGVVGRKA